MPDALSIREARPDEARYLSALALRSKAHWGYPKSFMDSCKSELTVEPARIDSDQYHCFVATVDGGTAGFYALERLPDGEYELEALFVEPARIGTGVGRELIEHAKRTVSRLGATRLVIQGDPHAADFYRAAGARQIGHRESGSIPGRYLPLFEITLE